MSTVASNENENQSNLQHLFLEGNFEKVHMPTADRERIRNRENANVEIRTSDDGIPLLTVNGKPIYNDTNPLGVTRKQIAEIDASDQSTLVVMFGFGLGYHAEQLERRFSCPIVIFEPSLDVLSATLGARPLNLTRTTIVSQEATLLDQTIPRLQFKDRSIVAAAIPEYLELFKDEFSIFKTAINNAVANAQILETTTEVRSIDWIHHAVRNVPKAADKPSIDLLDSRFDGVPGILVSAGPSLDRNIEALKKAEGKAVIIAVNAAVAPLAKAGIKPDFVAVVEGLDLRQQLTDAPWLKELTLLPTFNCFPGFFDLPVKHLLPIADFSVTCSEWFMEAYSWKAFPSGGSVSCTAFTVLNHLGCDPIVLIGQDLAYTKGNSYASGATFGKQGMRYDAKTGTLKAIEKERNHTIGTIRSEGGLEALDNIRATTIEAYGGHGEVYTSGIFTLFRNWFEAATQTWAKDRTLINATEGGARIRGYKEMPLSDVIEKYCAKEVPISNTIDDTLQGAEPNEIDALKTIIQKDINDIADIITLSRTAIDTAREASRILEESGMGDAEPALRSLKTTETQIREITRRGRIVDAYVSGKVNRLRLERWQDTDNDPVRQTINSLNRTDQLLSTVLEGGEELLALFTPIVEELNTLPKGQ